MRNLSANALTTIATKQGTEPIIVLAVSWGGVLAEKLYADKSYPTNGVEGRIVEMSSLNEAIVVSGGGNSQEISVTLSDTDGAIKAIFDSVDVHKKSVRVYQWFDGLAFSDKFLVFKGQINSVVNWSEGKRQITFSIINRIEDVEVGFSAEEGQFIHLPEELIGKPWPLCFGTTINVQALKAVPATSGTLAKGVGIKDFTIKRRIKLAEAITCPQTPKGFKCFTLGTQTVCHIAYQTDGSCVQARCVELEKLRLQSREQSTYEYTSFVVFGGERFQQNRLITLNINGGLFTGKMNGNVFTVTARRHPKDDGTGHVIEEETARTIKTKCEGNSTDDPTDYQDSIFGPLYTGIAASMRSWELYRDEPSADFFWAAGGSAVRLQNSEILYIANIVPSIILRVAAYRTVNGNRFLLTVPSSYYTVRQTDYNGYDVMEIVFARPLSTENVDDGGGWEDDIYITQTSTVGPNTVDIIEWFIDTYTDYTVDATSFDDVRTKVDKYSMHFPLLVRKNLITVLQEIATQARCALWQKDDVFFIKYLAETPTVVDTIDEHDILPDTLEISLSKTEELVTKYVAKWTKDHAIDKPNTLILRHNVILYGTEDQTYDYYTFNILDNVRKTATFWLIRKSITWKICKFSTALTKLNLESFDAVRLDLPDLSSDAGGPICIVQKAVYNSKENVIEFECWTPVPSGKMRSYDFAYPANVSEQLLFPSIEERNAGQAGSGKEPNFSVIAPPNHALIIDIGPVISGFSLSCNGDAQPVGFGEASSSGQCRQDHGDKKPSDTGDVKKTPDAINDNTGDVSTGSSPVSNGQGTGFYSGQQFIKDEQKKAQNDADQARKNAQRAQDKNSGGGGGGSDDTPKPQTPDDAKKHLDGLPKPDDLDPEENPCQVRVRTSYFMRKETLGVCVPDGGSVTEVYVFNDCAAAQAMVETVRGMGDCGNTPPCMQPCTGASAPLCGDCNNASPSIIAYERSDPDADPIMSLL